MKKLKVLANIFIFYFVLIELVSSEGQTLKTRDNRSYFIDTEEQYSWFDAYRQCKDRSGEFVIIDTEAKNDAIIELLKSKKYNYNLWLGGHDNYFKVKGHTRAFVWSALGSEFEFSYWSDKNEPHCVHISKGNSEYRWNVADCSIKMGFICELTSS